MFFLRMVYVCISVLNENLVLYIFNYGILFWVGIFWADVSVTIILGTWRKYRFIRV